MRTTLRSSVALFFIFICQLVWAQQPATTSCPGVPGACGYPSVSTQRNAPPQNPQNGNGTLGQIYNFSKCGLDFTTASQRLGQRFNPIGVPQPAPFPIAGIPICATIERAYLWAEGSGNGAAQTATIVNPAAATFNYPMTIVGQGPDKCWGYGGSYTYRADVTSCISGNGTYNISGLLTSPPNSGNDMDGATLMVIWSDPTVNYRGTMVIHDGAVVINGGVTTQNVNYAPVVCANTNTATAFCMLGDIQFAVNSLTMNGTNAPFAWNWWNYVSVPTTLVNGQATSAYTVNSGGDCYNLCVIGMYYRTTTCAVCPAPSSLTLNMSSTAATCSNCNGTATVNVVPAGAYTYSWSPSGGNAATATNLCPGTYTVTVTSACQTATATVTVASTGGGLTLNGSQTSVLCNGQCNGTATSTVVGGNGPYTYTWSPNVPNNTVGATNTASNLCAGTYTVTVTDANGCTGTRTVTITQPPLLTSTGSQVNILCNGQCTGSATVVAAGGSPGYTYSWAPSGGNTATASNRCAGTYTCTITDANGCTTTRSFTITQPTALTTTGSQVNVLCNGFCTGSATVNPSGGSPGYTYAWAPSGGNAATASNLCAGTYTCTVTDANGCTATRTFTITQPPALTTTGSQVNLVCNGQCIGSATVNPSGGSPGYTYAWAPSGGNAATASNLCAGNYTCTVTDANGCTTTRTFAITQPTAITSTGSQVNVLCNGQCTGSATVNPSGGSPGYTYAWAPSGGNAATASNLCAGTYTCTITDANGCTATRSFTITQPPALTASALAVAATCGNNNGSITVTAGGGSPNYTYTWNPNVSATNTATNLAPGNYSIQVTDANGCTALVTATVSPSSAIAATNAVTNILCFGGTGSATVTVTGNNGNVTYVWNPNVSNTNTASNLVAGSYTCTATDAQGCSVQQTITITQPPQLTSTGSQVNVLCNGQCTGSATVNPSGGSPGYTYAWAPSGGNAATASNLCAGTYTCTITDINGCTATRSFTITQPPALTASALAVAATCGNNNGSITVTAGGGSPNYTYTWNPNVSATNTATNLAPGNYNIQVTDANGCTALVTATVSPSSAIAATNAVTNILCFGGTGSATVTVTGNNGNVTYVWNPNVSNTNTASNLVAGSYTCTATDAQGCSVQQTITITQPPQLTATSSSINVACFGGNTGSASVVASGGVGAYQYNWQPSGGNSATASNLIIGQYSCTITDANGCTTTQSFNITQPPAITLTPAVVNTTCGNANGSITVTPGGGSPGFVWTWNPNIGNTATVSNLLAGSYTCTATDQNGCSLTITVTLTNAGSPTAQMASSTNVSCFGGNDGSATVNVVGGSGPYTYVWSSGGNAATENNLTQGQYTVTVTDANSCSDTAVVTITEPTQLTAASSQVDVLCFGNTTGSATITPSGGTPNYSYLWNTNGVGSTESNLVAGNYSCVVTDANGCTATSTYTITEPPVLTATASQVDVMCFGANTGSATATAAGGTPNYTYLWNTNGVGSTESNLIAGNYSCVVSDANGCTTTLTYVITEPPGMTLAMSSTDENCGQSNGTVGVIASGGNPNYQYLWQPGNLAQQNGSGLPANTYAVTVTDANGCTATDSVTVANLSGVNLAIVSSSNATCFGDCNGSATVLASGGNNPTYSYVWSSGGNAATENGLCVGNYSCVVTDGDGCTATSNVVILQPSQLVVNVAAQPWPSICVGASTQLFALANGGTPNYSYVWAPGNVNGNNPSVSPTQTTTYVITATDANGCSSLDSMVITINPTPVATISSDVTSGCSPLTVNFSDVSTVASPGVITSWFWDFGDGNTSNQQNPSHTYTNPGPYTITLTVTTADGCTHTIVMNNYINVFSNPIAAFIAGPQPVTELNPTITFTDQSIGAVAWSWSFGDIAGSSSSDQNPVFTYSNPECYQALLTVTSADGCIDTTSELICIDPDVTLYVPNAFSPNGDESNEIFIPQGIGIDPNQFEMWIFDRWGNMIFYTDDLNKGWNGKVQGSDEVCQIDTYVWKIKAVDLMGKKHNLLGRVSIVK